MTRNGIAAFTLVLLLGGCAGVSTSPPAPGHLHQEAPPRVQGSAIPPPVAFSAQLPPPKASPKVEVYSVVVNNVRVQDLLFALARDARVNVDIHPGIAGTVTLNAIDQTLPQILARLAKQADIRWEMEGPNLVVMPDSPFLRTYRIDYVNMARDTSGSLTVTTQIASTGASGTSGGGAGGVGGGGSNNSSTRIENKTFNRFWETLEKNVRDLLRETDKILPEGSSETVVERSDQQATSGTGAAQAPGKARSAAASSSLASSPNAAAMAESGTTVVRRTTFREAASVIANAEAGVISVRATARQHDKVQEFIDQVMAAARRQVLIEATIAEVSLSDDYQQGVRWSALPLGRFGLRFTQSPGGNISAPASSLMEIGYTNAASRFGNISAAVDLLQSFGTVKVLSSPKLSVLNNQTAVLKVVDNSVFFTIKADTTTNQTTSTTVFTTDVHSVPVGFVMNVTPQISDNDNVVLNIRPSVSRIVGTVADPNPVLKQAGVTSEIPIIRTREMESMIRIGNGNIAVMGGLMEDSLSKTDDTIPGFSRLPAIGNLFQNRNDLRRKTELVVFLRPLVIREPSIRGDFFDFRSQMPRDEFFQEDAQALGAKAVSGSSAR